jgi:hypothetical protein
MVVLILPCGQDSELRGHSSTGKIQSSMAWYPTTQGKLSTPDELWVHSMIYLWRLLFVYLVEIRFLPETRCQPACKIPETLTGLYEHRGNALIGVRRPVWWKNPSGAESRSGSKAGQDHYRSVQLPHDRECSACIDEVRFKGQATSGESNPC